MDKSTVVEPTFEERMIAARERIHERFFKSFDAADEAFSPDALTKQINAMLVSERRQIVMKLMGFDDRFGSWEVD